MSDHQLDGRTSVFPIDFALHQPRVPVTIEKWYSDALLDDGTVLLLYFGVLNLLGARIALVTAELFLPDESTVRGQSWATRVEAGLGHLRFGPASIEGTLLRFDTLGLSGELTYTARFPPFALREPFLADGSRALTWSVEVPDADVEGEVRWPGGRLSVRGRGYRDRVWFDLLPWRFPIRELVWGRAVAGAHATTWVSATTTTGVIVGAWADGRVLKSPEAGRLPTGLELGPGREFLDADVVSLEGLRLGVLRGLVGRLTGNPHETKYRAPCSMAHDAGVAVHEVVRWRA